MQNTKAAHKRLIVSGLGENVKLKDNVAIVTGGGRGIGRAVALGFAEEGANLVLVARTKSEIEAVASE